METQIVNRKSYMVNDEMVNGLTPRERHIQAIGLLTWIIKIIYEAVQRKKTGSAIRETTDTQD